jgi:demethoxyubiquinone hydroxylase (CLK1/Coq7/Cat5 family)
LAITSALEGAMQTGEHKAIDVLNSFLRGEISAVETYRQALEKVEQSTVRAQLEECLRSHELRVEVLQRRVQALGGAANSGSGVWGIFAKVVQGGADVLGEKVAIAALEEGEDHGRDDYKRDIDKLDGESRRIIEAQVLPEQERTHRTLSTLKHTLH